MLNYERKYFICFDVQNKVETVQLFIHTHLLYNIYKFVAQGRRAIVIHWNSHLNSPKVQNGACLSACWIVYKKT